MKVLILAPFGSPIVARLVRGLKKIGVEVKVASFNASDQTNVIDLGPLKSFVDFLKFWKINKIIKKFNPDVIHAHISTHYGLTCLGSTKPVVLALWGSEIMLDPYRGGRIKRGLIRFFNYLSLKKASYCHTSGKHIASTAEKMCPGVIRKTDVFYWGFPLEVIPTKEFLDIGNKMRDEFALNNGKYIVFNRGLSDVYNPNLTAKLVNEIINDRRIDEQVIVLRGFATDIELQSFKSKLQSNSVVIMERLLSEKELFWLYTHTSFHFSIPHSDALGGGVVEPLLLGSYPFLSNIPSYVTFSKEYCGHIIDGKSTSEVLDIISEQRKIPEKVFDSFSEQAVIEKMLILYKKAIDEF